MAEVLPLVDDKDRLIVHNYDNVFLWPGDTWLCFYQTRSTWSMDQRSTKKRSAVHNFVPTVTKFCVMWEGLSLPHDTKFGNCRGEIVDRRMVFIWSLIHGSGWSRLIKAEPGDNRPNNDHHEVGRSHLLNPLRPRQNGRPFRRRHFRTHFWGWNNSIPIEISRKFVPRGPINNIPALVQIMAWRRPVYGRICATYGLVELKHVAL